MTNEDGLPCKEAGEHFFYNEAGTAAAISRLERRGFSTLNKKSIIHLAESAECRIKYVSQTEKRRLHWM